MSGIAKEFIELRKQVIEQDFKHLNDRQRQAVMKTEGALLLLAGAGSGKTTVLIHRVINLLRYGSGSDSGSIPPDASENDLALLRACLRGEGMSEHDRWRLLAVAPPRPWEIIAITFTNKAAAQLKERLNDACGPEAGDIWACTFHSACTRILRREITRLGYGSSFAIYDEDDKKRLLTAIIKELGYDEKRFEVRSIGYQISSAKDMLIGPEEFERQAAGDFYKGVVARVYHSYQQRLMAANALDFDDIIFRTVEVLENFKEAREYYQKKFRYVMVDEYQDTNHAQYRLCALLAGGYGNLCVVGDDDQSIYKFRGATIANILEFEESFPGAQTIRLEQNYRSTGNILNAANEVIKNNQERKGKTLWTDAGEGCKVKIFSAETQEEEAQHILKTIYSGYTKGEKLNSFTVLYRNHALSNSIEAAFKRGNIPYRIVGGLRFFDRAEVKDMLAYLWVVHNPSDAVRLRRIINNPPRKIGAKTVDTLAQLAEETGKPMYELAGEAVLYPDLSRGAPALLDFYEMISGLIKLKDKVGLPELYDLLLETNGYVQMLRSQSGDEALGRLENVMELKSSLNEYALRTESPTLAGFLEEISLLTDIDSYDGEADAVSMMTIHSAKGLEFEHVFIMGAEEGLFPSYRSLESAHELEEERRLCYVAMTRAKKELHISSSKRRMLYGQTSFAKPSRFIEEIPEECVERVQSALAPHLSAPRQPMRRPKPNFASTVSVTAGRSEVDFHFRPGQAVRHKSFGEGRISAVTPMGGDYLLEVQFDGVGKKMMMAKTAAQFMAVK